MSRVLELHRCNRYSKEAQYQKRDITDILIQKTRFNYLFLENNDYIDELLWNVVLNAREKEHLKSKLLFLCWMINMGRLCFASPYMTEIAIGIGSWKCFEGLLSREYQAVIIQLGGTITAKREPLFFPLLTYLYNIPKFLFHLLDYRCGNECLLHLFLKFLRRRFEFRISLEVVRRDDVLHSVLNTIFKSFTPFFRQHCDKSQMCESFKKDVDMMVKFFLI